VTTIVSCSGPISQSTAHLSAQRFGPGHGSAGVAGADLPVRLAASRRPPASGRALEEATITGQKPATWAYAESFVVEDEVLERARARGGELGCTPVLPGVGAALRVLAAALPARSVVEIGTGAGVSGLWLLGGMPPGGVLTTIDVEPAHQRAAREAFVEAGVPGNRTRVISGRALDVLPRLTDGAYDLVLCDAAKEEYEDYLQQALRLLRSGGMVAFDNALWHDRVADPAQRDETTTAIRELGKRVRDHEQLVSALLPVGDGLLVAVKR
jgi:predicted O-methyltransferase YrrM